MRKTHREAAGAAGHIVASAPGAEAGGQPADFGYVERFCRSIL